MIEFAKLLDHGNVFYLLSGNSQNLGFLEMYKHLDLLHIINSSF